jgi:hypothetical protein
LETPGISIGYWNARKSPCCGALFGLELEQVLPVEGHLAAGHLVRRVPGEHLRERALARAVRPHDGVHLARVHGEVDAVEDLLVADGGRQILDIEHGVEPVWDVDDRAEAGGEMRASSVERRASRRLL